MAVEIVCPGESENRYGDRIYRSNLFEQFQSLIIIIDGEFVVPDALIGLS